MTPFLLRRLAQSLVTLLAISILVFWMMFHVSDPIATMLPRGATQADKERLRADLGLDRPIWVQYGRYMGRLARGDLGMSYNTWRPVRAMIAERAPATIELALCALALSIGVGVPLGAWAGLRPRGRLARLAMGGSLFGISIPSFWLGLILMMIFGVWLGWLPALGRGRTIAFLGVPWSFLTVDGLRHLILPALTLASYHMALMLRLERAEMSNVLRAPFIQACRARGLSERSIVGRHALRNTLIPVVTVAGLQFGGLLAFSVVTETIFQWPGLGKLLIDSVQADRPLVMAYLLLVGVVFLGINFLVDAAYAYIDPRIRWSSTGESSSGGG
jgi:peptide/nickel transport system permease protein